MEHLQITHLPEQMTDRAPDMTEIRFLAQMQRGSMVHCTLQAGETSRAGKHQTIEEMWYTLHGTGEVWLKNEQEEREETVLAGVGFAIPADTYFQVRNTGSVPLSFVIVTMPPWPGEHEWQSVPAHWPGK